MREWSSRDLTYQQAEPNRSIVNAGLGEFWRACKRSLSRISAGHDIGRDPVVQQRGVAHSRLPGDVVRRTEPAASPGTETMVVSPLVK